MKYFDKLETAKDAFQVVFIGYDPLEDAAAKMAASSIRRRTQMRDFKIVPIVRDELLAYDIFTRPLDPRGSTQFSITRFLVPYLMNYNGVGIFFDADMFFTRDIQEMFDLFDPQYAVQVPKHDYTPSTTNKMGGLPQTVYPRKQWSAVTIWNCDDVSNRNLTRGTVSQSSPSYLHQFKWLKDEEIGSIPLEYNYLVGENHFGTWWPADSLPFNIHHTLGAPLFRDCQDVEYADLWKKEFALTFGREFTDNDIIN